MFARIARVAAINLALLLLLAGAAELSFGTWFSTDPLDQLSLPRDIRVIADASTLYPGGGQFVYARDRWGLRGAVTDPAKVTILTIGGSTTNQLYLPEDQTWQKALEQSFRAEGHEVVVANAGIDGQSTVGHLATLERWVSHVPGLKPRFVLAYVGINDTHITGSWIDVLVHPSPWKQMAQKSAIVRLSRQLAGMVKARRAKLQHQAIDFDAARWTDKPNRPSDHGGPDAEGYKQRLKTMAQSIHRMGAVPVFITQPRGDYRVVDGKVLGVASAEGLNGVDQYRLLAALNQATREVCRDEGLLCLDLARELTFDKGDFYDYLHNTPAGAAKIGRWLHGKLAGLV